MAQQGNEKKDAQADRMPPGMRRLKILEVLTKAGYPMTPTDINETLGLPKPTVHRLCNELHLEGYLTKDIDGRRYLPGTRLRSIAAGVLSFAPLAQLRHMILQRLSEQIGETCNITLPDNKGMIYLDRVETHWPIRIELPVGGHVPFYCTASGKLYLSTLRRSQQRRLVDSLKLERHAPNTITDKDELLAALEVTRKNRIGVDNGEFVEGMVAVAVPIENENGDFIATLALHAPTQRMSLESAMTHIDLLQQAAKELYSVAFDPGSSSTD
jgi:DNA-binding IclR family transcriptional regulator